MFNALRFRVLDNFWDFNVLARPLLEALALISPDILNLCRGPQSN